MNPVTLEQVQNAAQAGENDDWEFKSAQGGIPRSFWESYSAMANTEGGWIVLGASEDKVYLGPVPFGHTFRRRHEGDYRCTDDEIRRMLADADPTPPDHRILLHFGMADLDMPSLSQYRQRVRAAKGEHPWLSLEDRELLENIGGWRADRASGQAGLTVAGLLMFGKDLVIREAEALPEYFVDYREKLDPLLRWNDRLYPDGTWSANLFQFYQQVLPKLSAGLPVPFRLQDGIRRDVTPAHEALREAFVNALIHSDYTVPGGVVVERYADHYVFDNPGTLMVSLEQYRRGGWSVCRNKGLQRMFQMIGGGEQAGSGVDKIRVGWASNQWRPPKIECRTGPDRIRLTLPMASLIPDDTLKRLRAGFGHALDGFSSEELQALATADLEGGVTNSRLQEVLTQHPVDIGRMLQSLCERGYLSSDNRRRWATYRLSMGSRGPTLFGEEPPGDLVPLPGDSLPLGGDSLPLGPENPQNFKTPLESIPAVAAVANKGKARPQEVRKAIMLLCESDFLTGEKIAEALKRNSERLRQKFLAPMVKEGMLRMRFPDALNRPDQAYTASKEKRSPTATPLANAE